MSGLDDLIGGLTKGGGSGALGDVLGGLLGAGGGQTAGASGSGGGLDDLLGGLLGGGGGADGGDSTAASSGMNMGALVTALAPVVIGMLRSGGLQKMMSGFQQGGMADQADSWVSKGPNTSVSGSEMRVGLGDGEVRRFAQEAGIPEDQAAKVLASVVPQVVDGLTPDGRIPSDDELEALLRRLQPSTSPD